ncbi:hypothetical protein [Pseudoalteromonas rubra]|nr:hypothetical protein [Pseudoalteromonas rubra]
MKTVFEHTQISVLVIPQILYAMKDAEVLGHYRNSAIVYKNLAQDLVDIEFYTNTQEAPRRDTQCYLSCFVCGLQALAWVSQMYIKCTLIRNLNAL